MSNLVAGVRPRAPAPIVLADEDVRQPRDHKGFDLLLL